MGCTPNDLLRAIYTAIFDDTLQLSTLNVEGFGHVTITRTGDVIEIQMEEDRELAFRELLGITSAQLDDAGETRAFAFDRTYNQNGQVVFLAARQSLFLFPAIDALED